jgi:hypothetical protein
MRITALYHTEIARVLAVLRVAVSSVVVFTLGRLPDETFWAVVVDELVTEFWKLEEWCSRLEQPGVRICDLLLRSPFGRVQLAIMVYDIDLE